MFRTVENLRGRGRKPKVTPVLARRIVREMIKNPRITTKAILVNLGSAGGNVSRQTVQRTLHTAGFHGRRPRRIPLLQVRHTKAQLAIANAHLDKEQDFWSSVLCSHKIKLNFFATMLYSSFGVKKEKPSTLRTPSPLPNPTGGENLMLWGCSWSSSLKMNGQKYQWGHAKSWSAIIGSV